MDYGLFINTTNQRESVRRLFDIAVLCNNATIEPSGKEIGDPLEVALLKWTANYQKEALNAVQRYPRIDEAPFSSETKFMSTVHTDGSSFLITIKGAVEEVIVLCAHELQNGAIVTLEATGKGAWLEASEELSKKGIRVLAFAYNRVAEHPEITTIDNLIIVALVGFVDPPQKQVPQAIDDCKAAGIKVVMLTGDHPATALYIAKQVHLADNDTGFAVNGKDVLDFASMTEAQQQLLIKASVMARVTPKQKLDIVSIYQQHGYIAAMTGDGVNDAPALKKADIGIAMGLRGTQMAKETADLVLKDDSFISIVAAVKQGRVILENIRKCIHFLLSCNLSEILIISIAAFFVSTSPLSPLQILYLNLITDVFPALALGMGKGSPHIMKQPPGKGNHDILHKGDWVTIIIYSSIITLSVLGGYTYCRYYRAFDPATCNNVLFIGLAFAQLWHVFNLPGASISFFKNEVTRNKYIWYGVIACIGILCLSYSIIPIRNVLEVTELNGALLIIILVTSLLPVVLIQLLKRLHFIP